MTIKNMAPYRRELQPQVPITIEAGGEFVFIDQGENLEVRVDGMIMPNRNAGDIMRINGAFKRVTVTSSVEQVAVLIIGFGEYNRLIISGELNISPYVTTHHGTSSTLPMDVTKTVTLENAEQWSALATDKYVKDSTTIPADCDQNGGIYFHDGSVYALTRAGLAKYEIGDGLQKPFDPILTAPKEIIKWKNTDGSDAVLSHNEDAHSDGHTNLGVFTSFGGLTITPSGEIWFSLDGRVYKSHLSHMRIEKFRWYEFTADHKPHRQNDYIFGAFPIGFSRGKYHFLHYFDHQYTKADSEWANIASNFNIHGDKFLMSFDPLTNKVEYKNVGSLANVAGGDAQPKCGFVNEEGNLCISVVNSEDFDRNCHVIDPTEGKEITDKKYSVFIGLENSAWPAWNAAALGHGYAVSENGTFMAVISYSGEITVTLTKDVTVYAQFSIKDPGADDSTKLHYSLSRWRPILPYKLGHKMYGGIIEVILGAMLQRTPPSNYLDYVTKLVNDNGRNTITYNAGTNSFYKKGLGDDRISFLNSDYTIGLLPDFFEQ
ncbi:hypothetical protein [Microbulbifer sp. PSTR4-B]|uniref:hypothetical protein n=1 Tax=Microbulbifer sp. PSTR4-B TaxID=3243396 RepID=UPI00403A0BEA